MEEEKSGVKGWETYDKYMTDRAIRIANDPTIVRDYVMDPKTDAELVNGSYIKDGMVLLISEPSNRALRRWVRVEESSILRMGSQGNANYNNPQVLFKGVHEDGSRRSYSEPMQGVSYLVKLASIPKTSSLWRGASVMMNTSFVNKFYELDPETEDLVPYGDLLMDGMVVLIESPMERARIELTMTENTVRDARVNNQWCKVTDARIFPVGEHGEEVRFVGIYPDGSKFQRAMNTSRAWYVKIDSIPEPDVPEDVVLTAKTCPNCSESRAVERDMDNFWCRVCSELVRAVESVPKGQ